MAGQRGRIYRQLFLSGHFVTRFSRQDITIVTNIPDTPENIKQTFNFYQRMGNEINDACENGKLECAELISPFIPQWHSKHTALLLPTYYETTKNTG